VFAAHVITLDDRSELVRFLRAVGQDRASIAEISLDPPQTSISFVLAGTGFVRPIPPRIREFGEQRSRPVGPAGVLMLLLDVCLPGAIQETARILPELRAALMAGREPASHQVDILWRSLRRSGAPATVEGCLLS